jgi:hypothetical protein
MNLSVLCITYQVHELLQEAMWSYIQQDYVGESEFVIINDSPKVKYVFDSSCAFDNGLTVNYAGRAGWTKKFRIINLDTRFATIGKKLEYGYHACKGNYVYRLDSDDLLMPDALTQIQSFIDEKPNMDVYRASNFHLFGDNKYERVSEGINNGNVLSREYIDRLEFPEKNADEDLDIIFSPNVKMYTAPNTITMIYRWGMNTVHISNNLHLPNAERLKNIPEPESGVIVLNPKFLNDYYGQLPV